MGEATMGTLGPYTLHRIIAQGGMGEVYLASLTREGGFHKLVALKCIRPDLTSRPGFLDLFEREARMAASLNHRNIVQIFDFGRQGGRSYLAMEVVHGTDLKALMDLAASVEGGGALPVETVTEIGIACCRALAYAHDSTDALGNPLQLIHGDISPQNVLLSFDGDIKIADFGLARPCLPGQQADLGEDGCGVVMGKLAYMSPEQASGRSCEGRSDQFSLGVVLYEAFSGERAFWGDDGQLAVLDRVKCAQPIMPLRQAASHLPEPLVRVVERAMDPDPDGRFSRMERMEVELREAALEGGVAIGDPSVSDLLGRWRGFFHQAGGWAKAVGNHGGSGTEVPQRGDGHTASERAATSEAGGQERTETAAVSMRAQDGEGGAVGEGGPGAAFGQGADRGPDRDMSTSLGAASPRRALVVALLGAALVLGGALWFIQPSWRPHSYQPQPQVQEPGLQGQPPFAHQIGSRPLEIRPHSSKKEKRVLPETLVLQGADPKDVSASVGAKTDVDSSQIKSPSGAAMAGRIHDPNPGPTPPNGLAAEAPLAVPRQPPPAPAPATMEFNYPDPGEGERNLPAPAQLASGFRVRVSVSGGSAHSGHRSLDDWMPLGEDGLLFHSTGSPGPRVSVRLRPRGEEVMANLDAKPWGLVLVDHHSMGETPLASVPLRSGTRKIQVRGPNGRWTEMDVDITR